MEKKKDVCAMEEDGSLMQIKETETAMTGTAVQEVRPLGESATNNSTPLHNPESVEKRFSRKRKYNCIIRRKVTFSPASNYITHYEFATRKVLKISGPTGAINHFIEHIDPPAENNYNNSEDSTTAPQHVYSRSCSSDEAKTRNIIPKRLKYRKIKGNLNDEMALVKDLPVKVNITSSIPFDEAGTSNNSMVRSVRGGKYCPSFTTEKNPIQNTSLNSECFEQTKTSLLNIGASKSEQNDTRCTKQLKKYLLFPIDVCKPDQNTLVSKQILFAARNSVSGTGPSEGEELLLPTRNSPNATTAIEEKISSLCQMVQKSHLNDSGQNNCFSRTVNAGNADAVQSTSGINTNTGNTKSLIPSKPKNKKFKKDIDDKDLKSSGTSLKQKMIDLAKTIADIDSILAQEIKCKDKYSQKGYKFTHSVLTFLEKEGSDKKQQEEKEQNNQEPNQYEQQNGEQHNKK